MLARSDRRTGTNPLIFVVCSGSTPDFSNLPAIRVRSGLGTSSLRSFDDARGSEQQVLEVNQLGVSQSKS
jgi:hypothetical protein